MKPTNLILWKDFDENLIDDFYNFDSKKCKVCGYRAGLHYEAEELGKVWCPAKPRRTFARKLKDLNI